MVTMQRPSLNNPRSSHLLSRFVSIRVNSRLNPALPISSVFLCVLCGEKFWF
jgi:hypothetical protein